MQLPRGLRDRAVSGNGVDHAEPDEEREMFELQRQLLLTFLAGRGRSSTGPV